MDSRPGQFGPYTLLYPLGVGGMGEVFLARHEGEHGILRLVAIKRMLGAVNRDERLVALFLDEVRIAAQLAHGNIVQVIDHGRVDRQQYMAMEYVHGENLHQVLSAAREQDERLATDLLLHIACCICQGLDHAHTKLAMDGSPLGIVHRDISPQNILISFQGQVKIADFGIARAAERTEETLGGELKGKLAYMSPEQANAEDLDQRSDIYSLGLVLYEALAGKNPLRRDRALATLDAVRRPEVPSLAETRPDLPPELVEQVHWALSPARDERPESARAFYEALQQTARLYTMVVTPFDLADQMGHLFPGAAGNEGDHSEDTTEVGRRADEQLAMMEQDTLCYLQERDGHSQPRHLSDLDSLALARTADLVPRRRLWPLLLLLFVLLAGASAGIYMVWRSPGAAPVSPALDAAAPAPTADSRPAPPPDQGAPPDKSARPDQKVKPPRPKPGPAPGPKPPLDKGGPARLTVRSTHKCRVLLGSTALGNSPVVAHPVPAGRVTVTCLDTAAAIRERRTVSLRAGEPARVEFRFGVVMLNLDPWATVSVDGKRRGTTPMRLVLREGVRRLRLDNAKLKLSRALSVEVNAGKTTRISSW